MAECEGCDEFPAGCLSPKCLTGRVNEYLVCKYNPSEPCTMDFYEEEICMCCPGYTQKKHPK